MRRPTIFLMLAVVAAFLAAMVAYSALKEREAEIRQARAQSVEIVVAAREIALGERIAAEAVKLARWPRESVPEDAFTNPAALQGHYANRSSVKDEPIVRRKLVSVEKAPSVMPLIVPPGMRAMSVPVDDVGDIAGFVKPRTRQRLQAQIYALTAQARLSGWVVGLLPVAVLAIFSLIQPSYAQFLFYDPMGVKLLEVTLFLDILALVTIRQLLKLKF